MRSASARQAASPPGDASGSSDVGATGGNRMRVHQAAAIGALLFAVAGLSLAIAVAVQEFPRGLIVLACVALSAVAAWYGLLRRGAAPGARLPARAPGGGAAVPLLLPHPAAAPGGPVG